MVYGMTRIVWAKYSYWTLGYILRLSGAKQLVDGEPLSKLIPVDEYLPVKFNEHANQDLLKSYYPRYDGFFIKGRSQNSYSVNKGFI